MTTANRQTLASVAAAGIVRVLEKAVAEAEMEKQRADNALYRASEWRDRAASTLTNTLAALRRARELAAAAEEEE